MVTKADAFAARLWKAGRWRRRAACSGMGPSLFFPHGEREEAAARQVAEAKGVCATCPVKLHCLTYALHVDPGYGVWGGLTPSERAHLRRSRRLRRLRRAAGDDALDLQRQVG